MSEYDRRQSQRNDEKFFHSAHKKKKPSGEGFLWINLSDQEIDTTPALFQTIPAVVGS